MREIINHSIIYKLSEKAIFAHELAIININCENEPELYLSPIITEKVNQSLQSEGLQTVHVESGAKYSSSGCQAFAEAFIIECDEDTEAFITFEKKTNHRVWINGKFRCLCNLQTTCKTKFNKGQNLVVITSKENQPEFDLLRINKCENEKNAEYSPFFNNHLHHGFYTYINDNGYFVDKKYEYKFIIMPGIYDVWEDDKPIRVTLEEFATGNVFEDFELNFGELASVNLGKYEPKKNCLNWLCLNFTYKKREGGVHSEYKLFCFDDITEYAEEYRQELLNYPKDNLCENAKNAIQYCLENWGCLRDGDRGVLPFLKVVTDRLPRILNTPQDVYLNTVGRNWLFFKSKIDDHIECLHIRIPTGYKPEKEYPVFFNYSVSYLELGKSFNYLNAIYVDMPCRGCTFSSYIGELAADEIIEQICLNYKIDKKRIYAFGVCAAGMAVLIHQQLNPGKFAGALVTSAEYATDMLCNVANIPIFYVESLQDSEKYNNDPIFDNNDLHKIFYLDNIPHAMIYRTYYQNEAVNYMLEHPLDQYPRKFLFKTRFARHLKSYWIELHGITRGSIYAQADVKVVGNNTIEIEATQTQGVTIILPPYIDRGKLLVTVNDVEFVFEQLTDSQLHFSFEGEGVKLISEKAICSPVYKGNGLIDVYSTPLKLVNMCSDDPAYIEVIRNFAHPEMMAWKKEIDVNYPILTDISESDLNEHSIIIVDDLSKHSNTLNLIRRSLNIMPELTGYVMNNDRRNGGYCIMQVIENPLDSNYSILHISTNDKKLLHKNFFTRRVILPSYLSGPHQYLNCAALIFDGNNYLTILDSEERK